jgi:hypothetical protein
MMTVLCVFVIYSLDPSLRYLQTNSWKMSLASTYFSNICFFTYLFLLVLFYIFLVEHSSC